MKERIGKLVGETEAKNLWMGTFHSVFARILRIEVSWATLLILLFMMPTTVEK